MSVFHARWTRFELRRPRHPLLRALCAALGLVLMALLVGVGLVLGTLMLAFTIVRRRLYGGSRTADTPARGPVIDGEYTVVRRDPRALPH